MGAIWEIDFYSRPLVDERQKKVWELLVCESPSNTQQSTSELFRYAQYCPSDRVNSLWLGEALQAAIQEAGESPQRIRFFRRQMNNMITKACKDIGIPAAASRRSIAIQQWLNDRLEDFYPTQPNYQATTTTSVQMFFDPPQPLPEALIGEKWNVCHPRRQSICGHERLADWVWRSFPAGYGGSDTRNADSRIDRLFRASSANWPPGCLAWKSSPFAINLPPNPDYY